MYTVQVIDIKLRKQNQPCIITTRFYNDLQNALSDVIDEDCDLHATIEDAGYVDYEAGKPDTIDIGGIKENGYGDDFHFRYPNGIAIVIGETIIWDKDSGF